METTRDMMCLAITAWCITKFGHGNAIRIPREEIAALIAGEGQVYLTGDPSTDEYIVSVPHIHTGDIPDEDQKEFEETFQEIELIERISGHNKIVI